MTDFNKLKDEEKHPKLIVLFGDSYLAILKEQYPKLDYHLMIADKKEQTKIVTMLEELGEKLRVVNQILNGAIGPIAHAGSLSDALGVLIGATELKPVGYSFCPSCLEKSILTCEEQLQTLKDIQALVKEHVA